MVKVRSHLRKTKKSGLRPVREHWRTNKFNYGKNVVKSTLRSSGSYINCSDEITLLMKNIINKIRSSTENYYKSNKEIDQIIAEATNNLTNTQDGCRFLQARVAKQIEKQSRNWGAYHEQINLLDEVLSRYFVKKTKITHRFNECFGKKQVNEFINELDEKQKEVLQQLKQLEQAKEFIRSIKIFIGFDEKKRKVVKLMSSAGGHDASKYYYLMV